MLIQCLLLLLSLFYTGRLDTTSIAVMLGDERVVLQQQSHGSGKAFVHLHQNERTALHAAQAIMKIDGGRVLTLQHHGQRNIVFHLHGVRYEFDPNRIFSDVGIQKTLNMYGPYSKEAHQTVLRLADVIKSQLPMGKVIAVHNNQSYSMRDYYSGQSLASEARALYINEHHSERNFYLVTRKKDFSRLKKLQFNSVLQAHAAEDDGSLSVYLAHQSYVNVEAGHHQLMTQMKMLRYA